MDKNNISPLPQNQPLQIQLPHQQTTIQTQPQQTAAVQTAAALQQTQALSQQQGQMAPGAQNVQAEQQAAPVQAAVLQSSEQAMIAELTQIEQQTVQTEAVAMQAERLQNIAVQDAAAPAPPIQQQRRRRTLKEKWADRKRRKAEERRRREEQREQERIAREEQAAREAEEQRQREAEEQRQREEAARAEAWRQEQEELMDEMDSGIRNQGSVKEARVRALLQNATSDAMNRLTAEEKEALRLYTTEERQKGDISYRSMNRILRDGTYQEGGGSEDRNLPVAEQKANFEQVTHAIHALEKSRLPQDLVVRRGTNFSTLLRLLGLAPAVGGDYEDMGLLNEHYREEKYNDGSFVCQDYGFLSTSPYRNGGFFAGGARGNFGVEFIIKAHQGDEALFIENLSESANEAEMLFQAGTRYRIIKICGPTEAARRKVEKGSGYKVYMETIPQMEPLRGKKPTEAPQPPQES